MLPGDCRPRQRCADQTRGGRTGAVSRRCWFPAGHGLLVPGHRPGLHCRHGASGNRSSSTPRWHAGRSAAWKCAPAIAGARKGRFTLEPISPRRRTAAEGTMTAPAHGCEEPCRQGSTASARCRRGTVLPGHLQRPGRHSAAATAWCRATNPIHICGVGRRVRGSAGHCPWSVDHGPCPGRHAAAPADRKTGGRPSRPRCTAGRASLWATPPGQGKQPHQRN